MGLKKVVTWVILALGCSTFIKVLLMLDLNKRVYNHVPGPCRLVEGIDDGSEDIELVSELGVAFITSGLVFMDEERREKVKGGIFLYDFTKRDFKAIRLPIEGDFDKASFSPHGISAFVSKKRVSLYVINHPPGGHTVEVFTFNKEKRSLTFVKTISDPLFTCPNDLAVVGADRFFITNYCYFYNKWLHTLESVLQLNLGSILFYDGKKATAVESWSLMPNGISVHPNLTYLYVASPMSEAIKVYKLAKDMSIEKHTEVSLLTSPDNMFIDPNNGDIWVGCHPVGHEVMKHVADPKNIRSSSQVLKVRMQEGHKSWVITEPYANDGATISGSTVAVYYEQQMLIGTIYHKLLQCDVINPDIV
uniref:Paraoxonase n=1 Tax=Plectus sambesii TaxID=2011161 RepID=A0A914WIH7_9BILA